MQSLKLNITLMTSCSEPERCILNFFLFLKNALRVTHPHANGSILIRWGSGIPQICLLTIHIVSKLTRNVFKHSLSGFIPEILYIWAKVFYSWMVLTKALFVGALSFHLPTIVHFNSLVIWIPEHMHFLQFLDSFLSELAFSSHCGLTVPLNLSILTSQ